MVNTLVYKFGGASVKDAPAVTNLVEILRSRMDQPCVIVVSAMGKTTNALEDLLSKKLAGENYLPGWQQIKEFHWDICTALFPAGHTVFLSLEEFFEKASRILALPISKDSYDEHYDQLISFGELFSSLIVSHFLQFNGLSLTWKDAREVIHTNSDFRFAKIDWDKTRSSCQSLWSPLLMATSLDAAAVTIWKDVPGVLNADPKLFSEAVKFEELGYKEAAEMTYFGASVIHPKTIKPLANAGIPLFVKSFLQPEATGTKIHEHAKAHEVPTLVLKKNQVLVSFKVTDFTFIEETHIHQIYTQLQSLKLRANMLQVSAISVSLVMDAQLFKLEQLLAGLKKDFEIRYNEDLELLTILKPKPEAIPGLMHGYEVLLEQSTRYSYQAVRRKG